VLSCLGDAGVPHYKRSRRGDAVIDRAVGHVLRHAGPHAIRDFDPYGYDERQYCSPGYDLAVGCFTRTPNGRYAEYHTSADDPQFVRAESLSDSLMLLQRVVEVLEDDLPYRNLSPFGEPQLGRRGLYRPTGGVDLPEREFSLLWVLNQSDGHHSLLEIAERSGLSFAAIVDAARALEAVGLLDRPEVSP
jgi:aminopeptidase-like protein